MPTVGCAGTLRAQTHMPRMPHMRLAASSPRDVSPTTPVMRRRRSRDLPRVIDLHMFLATEVGGDIWLTVVAWQGCSASLCLLMCGLTHPIPPAPTPSSVPSTCRTCPAG
jgi:hypothetical protein